MDRRIGDVREPPRPPPTPPGAVMLTRSVDAPTTCTARWPSRLTEGLDARRVHADLPDALDGRVVGGQGRGALGLRWCAYGEVEGGGDGCSRRRTPEGGGDGWGQWVVVGAGIPPNAAIDGGTRAMGTEDPRSGVATQMGSKSHCAWTPTIRREHTARVDLPQRRRDSAATPHPPPLSQADL